MTRRLALAGLLALAALVLYEAVTFGQVWLTSRRDEARQSQAIVVLGAAQYNGRPSAVLRARLDHAADLWHRRLFLRIAIHRLFELFIGFGRKL